MNTKQRTHRNCRGISTLEFIVVLPFLLYIMLVAVELSRALWTYNVVVQAAREGARVGVVTPLIGNTFNSGPAMARIATVLAGVNVVHTGATTVVCSNPCASDAQVTATVVVNFNTLFPGFVPLMTGLTFSERTVMRYE